jgi:hypothetical protein
MKEANPAVPESTALLIFWAVPAFIEMVVPRRSTNGRLPSPKRARLKKGAAERLLSAKNDIEAAAPAVTGMSTPYRRDSPCVTGYCEPVVDGRPDAASLDRRLARPMVPGY